MDFLFLELRFFHCGTAPGHGDFPGKRIFPGYHKPDGRFVAADNGEGVFLLPLRLEKLLGEYMEVQGNPGLGEFLNHRMVEFSPDAEVLHFFGKSFDLLPIFRVAHEHAAGEADDISLNVLRGDSFRNLDKAQAADKSVQQLYFAGELA